MANSQNVTKALERIVDLRNQLNTKGIELELKILDDDTGDSILLPAEATLAKTYEAFNSIIKRSTPSNLNTSIQGSVYVESGYYVTGFRINGTTTEEVLHEIEKWAAQNVPSDAVLNTYKTYQLKPGTEDEYELINGNIPIIFNHNAETSEVITTGDKVVIKPKRGYYNGSSEITTDITILTDPSYKPTIKVVNTTDGTAYILPSASPAGYYPNGITILPVVIDYGDNETPTDKVINVETKTISVLAQTQPFSPSEGYDFIKEGTINVKQGSSTLTPSISGNTVTLTPTITEGWINSINIENAEKTEDGKFVVKIQAVTDPNSNSIITTENNIVNVTPSAGYYDGNTSVIGKYNGEEILVHEVVATTVTTVNDKHVVVIPKGLITDGKTVQLGESSISTSGILENTIIAKEVSISTSKGYTEGENKVLTVTPGETPTLGIVKGEASDTINIHIGKSGWIDASNINVTGDFVNIADEYLNDGMAVFYYVNDLDSASDGIALRFPSTDYKYFKSAKVDLSKLIKIMDLI